MITERFEELSRSIWTNIYLSNKYSTIYGEETITNSILLILAKQEYLNIKILQTPKNIEGVQGTDWEWFVGSSKSGWIRYVIQAKKLNLNTNRYETLHYKVGNSKNGKYQIDLLQNFAEVNGAVPLYSFYNYYPQAKQSKHWHCNRRFDIELLGWTFTTLSNVKEAINTRGYRTFDKVHQFITLPISCLFKEIYKRNMTINKKLGFMGETISILETLPPEFSNANEIGTLNEFPEAVYNPKAKYYPKRIAIIDLSEEID